MSIDVFDDNNIISILYIFYNEIVEEITLHKYKFWKYYIYRNIQFIQWICVKLEMRYRSILSAWPIHSIILHEYNREVFVEKKNGL